MNYADEYVDEGTLVIQWEIAYLKYGTEVVRTFDLPDGYLFCPYVTDIQACQAKDVYQILRSKLVKLK